MSEAKTTPVKFMLYRCPDASQRVHEVLIITSIQPMSSLDAWTTIGESTRMMEYFTKRKSYDINTIDEYTHPSSPRRKGSIRRESLAFTSDAVPDSWRKFVRRKIRIENELFRESVSEFFATCTLVVFVQSVGASVVLSRQPNDLFVALGQGLATAFAVHISGNVTGGYLNPSITFASCVIGGLKWAKGVCYMLAQYLGAFFATAIVYWMREEPFRKFDGGVRQTFGANATAGIFVSLPPDNRTIGGALLVQLIVSGSFLFSCCSLADKRNCYPKRAMFPFMSGLLVTLLIQAFGFGEGMVINPAGDFSARVFLSMAGWGSDVFTVWNCHWIWITLFGTHCGATLGAILYTLAIDAQWSEHKVGNVL